jgi:hypothetical protein
MSTGPRRRRVCSEQDQIDRSDDENLPRDGGEEGTMRGPINLTGRGSGLLSAVFAAGVCSISAALPIGCAAPAAATAAHTTESSARGVAWRSTDRLATPRTLALSLGAGDRIGTRLEDVRIARATRERDALATRTAAAGTGSKSAVRETSAD